MCQLSIHGDASVQTRGEDSAGQQDPDGRLEFGTSQKSAHDSEQYIPSFPAEKHSPLSKKCPRRNSGDPSVPWPGSAWFFIQNLLA